MTLSAATGPAAMTRLAVAEPFPEFYERLYPELARYCCVLVQDRELAHDLTQEAFTRLLSRWVAVRDPKPYLFHIATNLVREVWRERARDRATFAGLSVEETRRPPGADADAGLGVREAVEQLPGRYREIVLLYYYADLPLDAVAATVRRPPGTVKRLLSEARALLARGLGGAP